MTERERLIELLKEIKKNPVVTCPNPNNVGACRSCKHNINEFLCNSISREADYLLANGVVVMPCKVGDTVFEDGLSSVIKFKVIGFKFGRMYDQDIEDYEDEAFPDEWHVEIDSGSGWKQSIPFSQIGKTVFLTREEAEKALKEREGS